MSGLPRGGRFRRVLIVKTGAFGDMVLASASFLTARRLFPGAELSVLTKSAYRETVADSPLFQDVLTLPPGRNPVRFLAFALRLRRRRFDLIVDLQGNLKTNCWTLLFGGGARAGFHGRRAGALFLHAGVRKDRTLDPMAAQERFWRRLGAERLEPLAVWIADSRRPGLDAWLAGLGLAPGTYAVIHPAASAEWLTKRWPEERFARLADGLARRGLRAVFAGDRSAAFAARRIAARMGGPAVNLAGETDFPKLAWLLHNARVLVSTDSGPVHLAAACGLPAVALFGPTEPARHLPPGVRGLRAAVSCPPCYRKRCPRPVCMETLSVETVLEAALEVARPAPSP